MSISTSFETTNDTIGQLLGEGILIMNLALGNL